MVRVLYNKGHKCKCQIDTKALKINDLGALFLVNTQRYIAFVIYVFLFTSCS